MASNNLRIDTDQVLQIAQNLEDQNTKLNDTLTEGKQAIDNLANVWQSDAATDTISNFDDFANKYFQSYSDVITQYVKFLRDAVAQGYVETENANIGLADAFK